MHRTTHRVPDRQPALLVPPRPPTPHRVATDPLTDLDTRSNDSCE